MTCWKRANQVLRPVMKWFWTITNIHKNAAPVKGGSDTYLIGPFMQMKSLRPGMLQLLLADR